MMPDVQLRVFDTTLRDGEHAPGFSLRCRDKHL
jgi:isopropylmalate/homocitrate/citramalate synthase